MKHKVLSIFVFTLTFGWLPGYSQDTLPEKKAQKIWQQVKEHVNVGGWIDVQYAYDQLGEEKSSVFQIRRARLDLKGSLSKWVDFRLQGDLAPNPRLIDAFVKVNFCKYVQLQVGQFKIPFSLENKLSPLDLELTENAQVISALSGYKDVTGIGTYSNGREIGLMLTGTAASAEVRGERIPILTYGIGIFGGNGINVKTDNMAKDISARLEFCPFVKGLTISISEYWGKYDMLYNGASTGVDGTRFRSAYGLEYRTGKLVVRSEYLWGVTDFALNTNGPFGEDYHIVPNPARSHGFYVVSGYWFDFGWGGKSTVRQQLRPVIRLDYYQKNLNLNDKQPSIYYSAGLDWWPEKHVRVQLNYTLKQRYNNDQLGHNMTVMTSVKF